MRTVEKIGAVQHIDWNNVMWKLLKKSSKLQWLGLIGIVGSVFEITSLTWFYLFWLFAWIDIFSPVRSVTNSLLFLLQNLAMLLSIPLTPLLHGFRLPSKESYVPQCQYSLPFEGKWHVVNGGVDKKTSHSWYMYSQRYAYDFFIVDEKDKSHSGSRDILSDYYCYKKTVLAPADGIVVAVKGKYYDTPIVEVGQADCAAPDVRGNHIIIRHSENEYSMIAHLLKDSICVKHGDKVSRGQKIALCGNSGNTSEPHIHFQIQSGKSFLFSAGLPISFTAIMIDGMMKMKSCFITNGTTVQNI
ncbi:M23 family metallopeptidase [Syntrophobotulus glycolicus]|nr:M23 family metallopeptidase [Syntrophobotulus glycolicus]